MKSIATSLSMATAIVLLSTAAHATSNGGPRGEATQQGGGGYVQGWTESLYGSGQRAPGWTGQHVRDNMGQSCSGACHDAWGRPLPGQQGASNDGSNPGVNGFGGRALR